MIDNGTAVVTILSTADFDNPIWTNKQHLAAGLAKTHQVVYINSLGLRSPQLNKTDIARIGRRLVGRFAHNASDSDEALGTNSIKILSPRVLPFHGSNMARRINSFLLARFVRKHIPNHERDVLWTFSPMTYGIESQFRTCIYHSVDLLHTFAHTPSKQILDAEKILVSQADQVIASSQGVSEHLSHHTGRAALLWENVADTELYSSCLKENPKKRAFFSGNLTPSKLDFDLLFALAESGVSIAVAGPIAIDGTTPGAQVQRLLAYENVEYLGVLTPGDLAREVADSRVGIVPYLVNSHTTGIFPMKVYEYLSAGLEVICTPLSSLKAKSFPDGVSVVEKHAFVAATKVALGSYDSDAAQARSHHAMPYSWTNRILNAASLIDRLTSENARSLTESEK